MHITQKISTLISKLSDEDQIMLRDLAESDPELFDATMRDFLQMYIAVKSGNKRAWGKTKERFDKSINETINLLEDETKIAELEQQLQP